MDFSMLSKEELLELIQAYDEYIQDANDEDRYTDGFCPVCIDEFYMNDLECWKENENEDR